MVVVVVIAILLFFGLLLRLFGALPFHATILEPNFHLQNDIRNGIRKHMFMMKIFNSTIKRYLN